MNKKVYEQESDYRLNGNLFKSKDKPKSQYQLGSNLNHRMQKNLPGLLDSAVESQVRSL